MRLGALLLQTRPWTDLAADFRAVEACGYDVAYVADHLTHPSVAGEWLADPWPLLAAAGAVTDRVELGTLVASSAFRTPVTLARAAATAQDVCGRRLVLGLGAGTPLCAAADRAEHPTRSDMTLRFADMVAGLERVWAGDAAWTGSRLGFDGVETLSRPRGEPPPFLLLAAHGPRAFALVARHGDGWSTFGGAGLLAAEEEQFWVGLTDQAAEVDAACERLGRDPRSLRRSVLLGYGTVRPLLSADAFADAVGRAEAAGFDEVVVYWPHGRPGDRFWSDVQVHHDAVARLRG